MFLKRIGSGHLLKEKQSRVEALSLPKMKTAFIEEMLSFNVRGKK